MGKPTQVHLDYAADLLKGMPADLLQAAREPFGACALVYTLLLNADESARANQLAQVEPHLADGIFGEMQKLQPIVATLDIRVKLPLLEIALPALRNLAPAQYTAFTEAIQILIKSDGQIDLFEYTLQKILARNLDPHFGQVRKPVIQYYAIEPLAPHCAVLLSLLAHIGSEDPQQKEAAFRAGVGQLRLSAGLQFLSLSDCNFTQFDAALNQLVQSAPQIKKRVLNACAHTIAADNVIQPPEAELLRAIADTLDCPIPPYVTVPQSA